MIGTFIGLIVMLQNLQGNFSQLGPGMALALLTTLYGTLLANFIFKPVAEKTEQSLQIMRYRNKILTQGYVMIAEKKDVFDIQDKMNGFLDPSLKFNLHDLKQESDAH